MATTHIQFSGYTNTITIDAGDTLSVESLSEGTSDTPTITLQTSGMSGGVLAFINGTSTFNNITINDSSTTAPKGSIDVEAGSSAGTLNLGTTDNSGTPYTVVIEEQLNVVDSGTLNIGDLNNTNHWSNVTFTPDVSTENIDITGSGKMNVYGPSTTTAKTVFTDGSGTNPAVIEVGGGVSKGNLSFLGQAVATDTVNAVVYNFGYTNFNDMASSSSTQWDLTGKDSSTNSLVNGGTASNGNAGATVTIGIGTIYVQGNFVQNSYSGNNNGFIFGQYGNCTLTVRVRRITSLTG
jgi:hypothetical protein